MGGKGKMAHRKRGYLSSKNRRLVDRHVLLSEVVFPSSESPKKGESEGLRASRKKRGNRRGSDEKKKRQGEKKKIHSARSVVSESPLAHDPHPFQPERRWDTEKEEDRGRKGKIGCNREKVRLESTGKRKTIKGDLDPSRLNPLLFDWPHWSAGGAWGKRGDDREKGGSGRENGLLR